MIKAFLPYLYTGAIVTATGGAGYLIAEKNGFIETETPAQVALVQPDAGETKTPAIIEPVEEVKPEAQETEATAAEPVLPSFSTLRVEQDGSTVIAGSAPENSVVEILNGDEVIAKAQSATNGDFVVVLDKPLKPGSHSLIIRAKPKEGEPVFSAEAGLINIPKPDTQEEVTVLVSEADKPSRILQKPEAEEPVEIVSDTASASVEVAKVEEAKPEETPEVEPVVQEEVKTEELQEEPAKEVEVAAVEPETKSDVSEVKPAEIVKPQVPVLIEAADVENSKVFIAGTGEAGRSVNLYLNSKFLGTARVTKNNAFLYEGGQRLKAGSYDLRADMIDTETGKVVARAEVRLVHEPEEEPAPVQAAEVTPGPEPKPVETEATVAEVKVETPEPEVQEEVSQTEVEVASVEEPTVEKTEIRTGTAVIIRRGDSLWRVASRNYGEGIRYTTIFEANRDQVRNPNLIFPGQVLKVPENEEVSVQ